MAVCLFLSYTPLSGVRGFGAATRLSGSVAARDRVGCAGEYIRTFFPASRDLEYNFGVVWCGVCVYRRRSLFSGDAAEHIYGGGGQLYGASVQSNVGNGSGAGYVSPFLSSDLSLPFCISPFARVGAKVE